MKHKTKRGATRNNKRSLRELLSKYWSLWDVPDVLDSPWLLALYIVCLGLVAGVGVVLLLSFVLEGDISPGWGAMRSILLAQSYPLVMYIRKRREQ